MSEDETKRGAINLASKALHEAYFGPGTWVTYGTDARGHARKALQRALTTLSTQGFELVMVPRDGAQDPSIDGIRRIA